ncbi:GNAT family N-acetyltransferase [Nocardia sp. NPDC005366]|uniref:GNAT family N-acetyltransferase n=1 Tax=Nocardia sp. NPDC005366 TaxID=3156878 RepID=UPI0033AD5783
MTLVSGITIRSATENDVAGIGLLGSISFGFGYEPPERRTVEPIFPVDGALVAVDGDRVVGHSASMAMTLTVPGARTVRACGISAVGVAPTHRRRGILRAMYTEQHRRTEADGVPVTIFTASRATIYGRFGYAPTIQRNAVSIDRRFAQFLPSAPDPGGVTVEVPNDVTDRIKAVYDRWRRQTPGAQVRPESSWAQRFADPPQWRAGETTLLALTHPDGYVLYRYRHDNQDPIVRVVEFRAVTTDAHAALWRALLGLDLVVRIEAEVPDNDPLPYLLTDSRLMTTHDRSDSLWLRIMDVPAALMARAYRRDLDVVLAVTDPFRDAGGVFALRVRDGDAECAPTTRAPDLELGIDVLGGIYLGAYPARAFAAANRLRAKDIGQVRALDEAFASERDAELGWFF